jgi:hypothetical protein
MSIRSFPDFGLLHARPAMFPDRKDSGTANCTARASVTTLLATGIEQIHLLEVRRNSESA